MPLSRLPAFGAVLVLLAVTPAKRGFPKPKGSGIGWRQCAPCRLEAVPGSPLRTGQSLSSFLFPFCTAWRKMKPFGKVLCAAGSLAVLLAFFWRDTFQPEQLSGARVLLTGASAGIGEQMAYHYATFGAEIVLTARREAVLQEGASVRHPKAGRAGLPGAEPHWHFPFPDVGWRCGAQPLAHGGKIPTPFTTSYSATKFALDGFFSSLRHELMMQERNVSITLCILGLIDTATALEKTRGKVFITASPAPEAALAIIRGAAARLPELFYPWWLRHVHGLWVLLPNPRVLQSFYNHSAWNHGSP
ncbi:hydroxysteroid 11-beta-dehydrogenase 1-like protein isoform X3 [Lagopus muta]|uniref:hydroxysteroid 11-beta-dehydrogenase 1-like protein isoform X3 n=1 Tax=Lagopus muta TaxID=64668 RepID=UPI0020A20716|nr:hydroxysteroid 11-beta-dehydrogenase 1-like protein isoform X3 [Lagopus muta]